MIPMILITSPVNCFYDSIGFPYLIQGPLNVIAQFSLPAFGGTGREDDESASKVLPKSCQLIVLGIPRRRATASGTLLQNYINHGLGVWHVLEELYAVTKSNIREVTEV